MKYFKKDGEVFAFEADGSQDHCILEDMIPLTSEEIERITNPDKFLSAEQKRLQYLQTLRPLTRRQFKLILLEKDLLTSVETAIDSIQDTKLKMTAKIEWEDATEFRRLNPTLMHLYKLMGISESKLDSMWEDGLKL